MGGQAHSIKRDFSLPALCVIPVGVAVNFAGGRLAPFLRLPAYLDTTGTIFASMLCGPWVGALTGGLTNVIIGFVDPVFFVFIPVNVIMGLVTGFLARNRMFSSWRRWIISVLTMTLMSILSAVPVMIIVFGGITGGGTSSITAVLVQTGTNIWFAVIGSEGLSHLVDRTLSCFVSWFAIGLIPGNILVKFGCGRNYLRKAAGAGSEDAGEGPEDDSGADGS
ncbi:MAG: ECF transporter S component [Treponema sp.]|nr:ECF transporter S component [Treponema sp.]